MKNQIDWNAWAKDVHNTAAEHGWWQDERPFYEVIALCHSELSEALEEYRDGSPMEYFWVNDSMCPQIETYMKKETDFSKYNGQKTDGIAVELVDCVIRILDYFGGIKFFMPDNFGESAYLRNDVDLPHLVTICHGLLSMAYYHENTKDGTNPELRCCVADILLWLKRQGVDFEAVMRRKHEYNKTRSYKHGGKVC